MLYKASLLIAVITLCGIAITPVAIATTTDDFSITTWSTDDGLPQSTVNAITQTTDGYIWVATLAGIARFDGVRFQHFNKLFYPDLISNRATALTASGDIVFIGDFNGMVGKLENGEFSTLSDRPIDYGDIVISLRITSDGSLEVRRIRSGVEIIEGFWPQTLPDRPPPSPAMRDIPALSGYLIDGKGRHWISSMARGLYLAGKDAEPDLDNLTRLGGLLNTGAFAMHLDHEDNLWVGTNRGLVRVKPRAFRTFYPEPDTSIGGLAVAVTEFRGDILLGSRGGGLFRAENQQLVPVEAPFKAVTSMLVDSNKVLWVGQMDGKVFTTQNMQQFDSITLPISGRERRVYTIFEDPDGMLWFGTAQGLIKYDGGNFTHYTTEDGLSGNAIRSIAMQRDGTLWFGTRDFGLNKLTDAGFETITRDDGLADNSIWSLHVDTDDVVWAGTFGDGISRIEGDTVTALNTGNGLINNIAGSIISDDSDNLWIGSGEGIFSLSRAEMKSYAAGEIDTYLARPYSQDQSQDRDVTPPEATGGHQTSAIRDGDGNIWIVTIEGLVRLDPSQLASNPVEPPVQIESFVVDGQALNQNSSNEAFIVSPGAEHLTFTFTALSFAVPEKVVFSHLLEGYESVWTTPSTTRNAQYTLLPPGEYTFRVRAANNDGVWNDTGASVPVIVQPFFWQTLWFQGLMLVLAGLTIALTVRYVYQRRLERQAALFEKEMAVRLERARIAQDLHDDIGARLTQLGMMVDADRPPEDVRAKTREMSLAMDEVVWSVDPERDSTEDLIDYIESYAEEFFEASDIACRFDFSHEGEPIVLPVAERHAIFSCVKESLNNAAKHAACSEIIISAHVADGNMQVDVTDNGKGFDVEGERQITQSGVANMENRMRGISGQFSASSGDNGTSLSFILPLSA